MILVKKVEIEYVYGREAQIAIMNPLISPWTNNDPLECSHQTELIQAKVFINNQGEEVIVGFSHEVQDLLGIPMEAITDMSNQIDKLQHKIDRQNHDFVSMTRQQNLVTNDLKWMTLKVEEYRSAGLWKRLKFLFRGRI